MKKNVKKLLSLALAAFLAVTGAWAGSNERGIDLYRASLYEAAKIFFLSQTNQSAVEQAENQYYLGETYYELQQPDSAAYYYAKAVETSPEYPFGYVGQGQLALAKGKGDIKMAESLFKTAIGYAKKDPSVQTTIAEAYVDAKMFPQAEEALTKAEKINKKYSGIYMARGYMALKENKRDQAYGWYEQAIYFDPNDKVAYLKLAKAYEGSNSAVALEYLDKLVTIDPDYIPAYALIGDINRENGMYLQALRAYEKFISIPGVPLQQHQRYAELLYFTDQYDKSLQQIAYVLKQDPTNQVMHRIQAYDNFKLGNTALAAQQLGQFMKDTPADKHIYLDYITYGQALSKDKQPEKAIEILQKAAQLDASKAEVYKELASAYEASKNYPAAIEQYEKYFQTADPATLRVQDYLLYGLDNYYAASKYIDEAYLATRTAPDQKQEDDIAFRSNIDKGNSAFTEVIDRSPDSYLGYLSQARLNAFVDLKEQPSRGAAMKGYAKPYYEQALQVMLKANEDGRRNNEIIEAYDYMASYYLLLDDKTNAVSYYKKILEVDPSNAKSLTVLKQLNVKY